MLTRLRFKNWRSLKDVTIDDLQPINVFIGANSSGKTNIVDGLHFLRHASTDENRGVVGAVKGVWGGYKKIRTFGSDDSEKVEIEFSYMPVKEKPVLTFKIGLQFSGRDIPLIYDSQLIEGEEVIHESEPLELPFVGRMYGKARVFTASEKWFYGMVLSDYTEIFVTKRWQILAEVFLPEQSFTLPPEFYDWLQLSSDASNLPHIIEIIRDFNPTQFNNLQDDVRWIVDHVQRFDARQVNERGKRLVVYESILNGAEARTISVGTKRIVAMLAMFYLLNLDHETFESAWSKHGQIDVTHLDITHAEMPGLVVIEEPDTALHPLLHQRFVEQLRNYVSGEHPRQVIMTTHNPHFLNHFQPEEVRIVERDERGYTTVKRVPDDIRDIWLSEYGLGDVWTTRSIGGVPE